MPEAKHSIIILGSSAGGWEVIPEVLGNLPEDLPAAVFVIQHLSSENMGESFLKHLSKRSILPCAFAVDGEPIVAGRVYIAPPDHHLLLTNNEGIRITKGPRENGFRPSIDTSFRSAAASFTTAVIGVILSGLRDDGVEGLVAIERTNGITVVQDPQEAPYSDMPRAALERVQIDYTVSTVDLGLVLASLVNQPGKPEIPIPKDVSDEAAIAVRVLTSIDIVEEGAVAGSPFTCPSCGGVLWDFKHSDKVHSFRCHAGHAFTFDSLYQLKATEVEETLWASLRLLEEQKRMLGKFPLITIESTSVNKRIAENQHYIDILRTILLNNKNGNGQQADEE